MNRLRLIKTAYTALAALMLAACASDELADSTVQDLPEGKYPLQISSVTMSAESTAEPWGASSPQTRVSENTDGKSSKWNLNDVINVKLAGVTETATFKVSNITTDAVTVTPTNTVYWTKNTDNVAAWYSTPAYTTATTVDLANQTSANGLAYVLGATQENASHTTPISLDFSHQLAKVRVKLTGDKASEITAVKVKGYPSCTIDKASGTVTKNGTETYLSTIAKTYTDGIYYEANLAPQDIITTNFVQLTDKSNNVYPCTVSGVSKLDKAKYYVFNIEVKSAGPTEIQPGADGNYTVNNGDNVIIDGKGTESTASININGTATVTLHNVVLKNTTNTSYVPVKITDGTATIILEGENVITSTAHWDAGSGIQLSNINSNVIIKGTTESKLTVSAGGGNAAIGSRTSSVCGDIRIESATIVASTSSNYAADAATAIGSGSAYFGKSGCGTITIIDSDITASVTEVYEGEKPAVIGTGSIDTSDSSLSNSCQGISITLKAGQSKDYFLAKLTGEYYVKVGAGQGSDSTPNTCGTISWYNSDGTTAN